MATFLEAFGVLQNFSVIFTFLFVWVLVYGTLTYTKFLGENNNLNAILAVVAAILFSLSDTVVRMFEYAIPWFVMLVVFVFLLIFMFRFLGATEENIADVLKNHVSITVFVFAFVPAISYMTISRKPHLQIAFNPFANPFFIFVFHYYFRKSTVKQNLFSWFYTITID